MILEIKKWIVSVLLNWAFDVCPKGDFRTEFAIFINNHIMKL